MKKTLVTVLLAIFMAIAFTVPGFAAIPGYKMPERPIKVYLRSAESRLNLPILENNGRTLYPFRELLEQIGAEVSWDDGARAAKAVLDGVEVVFPIDQSHYFVNGSRKEMDTAVRMDEDIDRTYIPIRYAMEAFGFDVAWIACRNHDEIRITKLGEYSPISDEDFAGEYFDFDYTSVVYYDIDTENKRLIFKNEFIKEESFENVIPDEKLNPDINRQLYDLSRVLADKDRYLYLAYGPAHGEINSRVLVKYAFNQVNAMEGYTFFDFVFDDKVPFDVKSCWNNNSLSQNSVISLRLGKLWEKQVGSGSTEYFEKKLRDSMIALFGEKTGTDIYDYAYMRYIQARNEERDRELEIMETRTFGNIKVDYVISGNALLHFYFSYLD